MLISKHYYTKTLEEAQILKKQLNEEYHFPQYMHKVKIYPSKNEEYFIVELTYSSLD